jgi:hypothetical protein
MARVLPPKYSSARTCAPSQSATVWVSGVNYLYLSATIILAGVMGFDSITSSG